MWGRGGMGGRCCVRSGHADGLHSGLFGSTTPHPPHPYPILNFVLRKPGGGLTLTRAAPRRPDRLGRKTNNNKTHTKMLRLPTTTPQRLQQQLTSLGRESILLSTFISSDLKWGTPGCWEEEGGGGARDSRDTESRRESRSSIGCFPFVLFEGRERERFGEGS